MQLHIMSSDEEDLDLNDEGASQLDNNSDGEAMDTEDLIDQSFTRGYSAPPPPSQEEQPIKRDVQYELNPRAIQCHFYDIMPIASAIHPNAIYSLAATRCFRWVLTGSDDGFIRKWDFFASMNGKTPLTQAQRHHLGDSVANSGVISSWWENEEQPEPIMKLESGELDSSQESANTPTTINLPQSINSINEPRLSPAFSMDLQSEALWSVQGMESGSIQLVTIRHDEGKCHHVFRKHTMPVSVLRIIPGETGIISGSWDKNILEWDLNTGSLVREYSGHVAQLSTAHFQPIYTPFMKPTKSNDNKSTTDNDTTTETDPIDTTDKIDTADNTSLLWDEKNSNIFLTASVDGQVLLWDRRMEKEASKVGIPEKTPPWTLSACWSTDGSKIYVGRRNGTVDEWDSVGQKHIQSLRMPLNSGPVYHVNAMPNGKHIICASTDNIRLWNTDIDSSYTIRPNSTIKPSSVIPFTIIPGHHGGMISHIVVDPTCRYMITASGNRGWEGVSTNTCLFYDISPIV
ncbi:WD40-repeat-containing domain protein [Chlamydoabsidia padenii]|nr:WD40-repeat-containing domain protein [Chlamydoabsidia padenii]